MNTLNSGFTRLSDQEFEDKVDQIIMALTENPKFPNPSPTLAVLQAKLNTYQEALAMHDGKMKTQAIKAARADMQKSLEQLARNLEMTPGVDQKNLATTGFDLRKAAVRSDEPPPAPANVRAKSTGVRGEVQFFFDPSPRAKTYELETTIDPNTGEWIQHGMFSSSRGVIINGLERGKDVWGRLRAIGPKNTSSDWSNPASVMVS